MRALLLTIGVGVAALLLWEIAAVNALVDPALLPPASAVLRRLADLVQSGEFYRHLSATMLLLAKGFGLALLLGVPLGVAMGVNRTLNDALSFYVDFFRALPAAALIPMFMVLFTGDIARVLVIGLSGSLIIAVACRSGVKNVEPARLEVVSVLGFSPVEKFRKLLFWEMLSEFLIGARIAISITFIVAIVLEMLLGAHYGLGDLLLNAQPTDKPLMYAVILTLGMVGYTLNLAFSGLDHLFARLGVFQGAVG